MKSIPKSLAVFALAALVTSTASAGTGWGWQRKDGNNCYVTNDVWQLKLNLVSGTTYRISYLNYTGSDGVLDVTAMGSDLAEQGYNYTIDGFVNNAFDKNTTITEVLMCDSMTYLGREVFRNCTSLGRVKVSANLSSFYGTSHFLTCTALTNMWYTGVEEEPGVIKLPPSFTVLPEFFMADCSLIKRIEAPGIILAMNRSLKNTPALTSVRFSTNLVAMLSNGTAWNQSVFHNDTTMRANLVNFQPSTMCADFLANVSGATIAGSTYTTPCNGLFANTGITNSFDFSACSFDQFGEFAFAYTSIGGATIPATVTNIGNRAFAYLTKSATFRFLGAPPTFQNNNNGSHSVFYQSQQNKVGYRHTIVVDAATYPAWTDPAKFVAVADFGTNSIVNAAYSTTSTDYPGEHTLGVTTYGFEGNSGNGSRYAWLVQYVADTAVTVTWKNGSETLGTDSVEPGSAAAYTGTAPTKAATSEYTYTFLGWNTDPDATAALTDLTVTADTTFYAIFKAEPVQKKGASVFFL